MRGNQQFPVATHILAFVGLSQHFNRELPTSNLLASSVNTNPVVIRRINQQLKAAGLINVRAGVGGVELLKDPKTITLQEIYLAVQENEEIKVFDLHHNVNPDCEIGSVINQVLSGPLIQAEQALEKELSGHYLYQIMEDIAAENNIDL